MPGWQSAPPKDDAGYFDILSRAIFTAGLNWRMVEKKWPAFREAFEGFSPTIVAAMTDKDVRTLMKDKRIVRNERKIEATVENAKTILDLQEEHGSVRGYIDSFGKKEKLLLEDLPRRFRFMGPSTSRMFLWMVGYPLTPTNEEKTWMKAHPGRH